MTRNTIERLLSEVLNLALPPEPKADLLEQLDSLSLVELLFGLEQEYGIEFMNDDLDFESFRTIERIVEFVDAAVGEAATLETQAAEQTVAVQLHDYGLGHTMAVRDRQ